MGERDIHWFIDCPKELTDGERGEAHGIKEDFRRPSLILVFGHPPI
jgi:hypothetical protein